MERRDSIILGKVLSEIQVAVSLMNGCSLTAFQESELLKRAICMTVINIGELVKTLSDGCRQTYPQIPWRAVAGFRDIVAHKYQTLKMEDVYETVTGDLPKLAEQLKEILSSAE